GVVRGGPRGAQRVVVHAARGSRRVGGTLRSVRLAVRGQRGGSRLLAEARQHRERVVALRRGGWDVLRPRGAGVPCGRPLLVTVGVQAGEVVRVLIVPVVAFLAGPRLAGGTRLGGAPRTPAGTRFLLIRHGVFVELGYVVDSAAGRVARGTPRPLRHLVLHSL